MDNMHLSKTKASFENKCRFHDFVLYLWPPLKTEKMCFCTDTFVPCCNHHLVNIAGVA